MADEQPMQPVAGLRTRHLYLVGSETDMKARFVPEADDWRGLQSRCEKIVRTGPGRFELVSSLANGEPISVRLGRFAVPPHFAEPS